MEKDDLVWNALNVNMELLDEIVATAPWSVGEIFDSPGPGSWKAA